MVKRINEILEDVFRENLKRRLSFLDSTWEELSIRASENPRNVRRWARHGKPTMLTLEKLGRILGVPPWVLLDPDFNPANYERDFDDRKKKVDN